MKTAIFLILFSFSAFGFDPTLRMASTNPQFAQLEAEIKGTKCLAMMNHAFFNSAPVPFKKFMKALCREKKGKNE